MNKGGESDIASINKNQINYFNKNIANLPNTVSNCFIKKIKTSTIQKKLPKKYIQEKFKFNKIIIKNIKKYDLNQSQKNLSIINDIIDKKQNHFCSMYRDYFIYKCQEEFFRKYYHMDESVKRFPKFYLYYCNYFKFFLKPTLSDLYMCDLIRKNGDNQAKYFYDKYNHFKDKTKEKGDKYDFKSIFTIITKNEIDNNTDIVNSDNISKIENNNTNTNTNTHNNPKQKNINKTNFNQSTLILSYDSLNNSKNKNMEQIEEPSISLLSIANLINQNKNLNDKDEENRKTEEEFIKNKINLFLNLNDKITQKSTTILTSARSKIFDSLKEKTNLKRRKNVFKYKSNKDEIHNLNNDNSNNNIRLLKNENQEIKHDLNLNSKNPHIKNNINLSLPQKPKINKIYEKNNKNDSPEKININKENKMIVINSRNDKRRNNFNYINTNINLNMNLKIKIKTNTMNLRYTKSNTSLNTLKNLRPRKQPSCTLKTDCYQTSHITNNNSSKKCYSSISNLKSSINSIEKISQNKSKNIYKNSSHKNYNNFTTQITRVQKKVSTSRNISTDFTHNRKMDNPPKNIYFFSSGLSQINKNEKIYKNNNICLSSHIFYKTFKNEDNKNIKGINNLKKDSEKKISVYSGLSRKNLPKNRLYSSSIEDKKQTLNKLFKELENLTLLKHNKENNIDKSNRHTVIEYNQKYN